jgi:sulfonate transport system permease protein
VPSDSSSAAALAAIHRKRAKRVDTRSTFGRLPRAKGLVLPIALLLTWSALSSTGTFSAQIMPSPEKVARDLWKLSADGQLLGHIGITTWRITLGFLFGVLAATVLGAATGSSRDARAYLDPTIQALKAVPSLAWVPLFILWFGIFEASKITLIAVGVFFPVYLNLMSGIQGVDRKLIEVGQVNNLGRLDLIRRILIPATLPSYFTGLRAGLALGWMFVIAAELMGASRGLGFLMIDGEMTGRPSIIIVSLVLFALVGKATDSILVTVSRRVLSWQDDFALLQRREGA